jgi:hypothetical protein
MLAPVILIAAAFTLAPPPHRAGPPDPDTIPRDTIPQVYAGRDHHTSVPLPRLDATVEIDGTTSAPAWRHAAVLTGFSEYTPVDGPPAEDSTEVLVWYSPSAIYFGIRAFEAHGAVHAALSDRDKIDADDNVQLILSPFIHGQQALVFAVNALGVQEDGTITEGTTASASFGVVTKTGRPPTDLDPDFVYESKGHLTPYGYEVVIRIPFRSIKYQTADPQDWGLNIVRKVQHSGHETTWAPTALAATTFLDQSGALTGLTDLHRGLVLDLNPFVTERIVGASPPSGKGWQYDVQRPAFGGNVRWGITNNLTLDGTYRPDFAEVESDATQVQSDPRVAIYYPEKRPFFLDGLEQFNTPNTLIYTRQIEAPIAAAKLTGKVADMTVAYLTAQDHEGVRTAAGGGQPLFNILRLQRDVGATSQVGLVATDREDGGAFNRVGGLDTRLTFGKIYAVALQGVASSTRTFDNGIGRTSAGPLWEATFDRAGRTFGIVYNFTGIAPDFVAGSGFISRTGVANMNLDHRLTFYGRPGALVETVAGDFAVIDTWVYRHLTAGQAPEDRRWHFTGTVTLHGGWQLGAALYYETYGYDPSLYANYLVGHIAPHDTTYTPFTGQPLIPNTDEVLQFSTPQWSKFSASITYIGGHDENFFEWAPADIYITSLTVSWRPTSKLRWNGTFSGNIYRRHTDGSLAESQLIPRLDVEYQLSRPIFFRIIAQYDATHQDSLRDDNRTNLPLFTRDPATGTVTRLSAFTNNQVQFSALFSYQPVPGTVAFVGYGNNLTEPTSFHLLTLRRTADSFFVKFSYLFRL